ncbi:hypothetical protein [Hymenobacter metallilatus]|uniref:Uncharacterized protein n=1 Tax=Hymenobacter metallilatus TaxID=2493666 RepID=A0A3R9MHT0_9BACT|nr:hypothetical protein [Hymenobacter metallilatus]RSK31771.1 hypothetical protein EI290_13160 [Hymenobacter metallilatus]
MLISASSPFGLARAFVFRRYLTLRPEVAHPAATSGADAALRARKLRKKRAKQERLRNFFGWCAGCEAYGSIF